MSELKSKIIITFDNISISIHPNFVLKLLRNPHILHFLANMTMYVTNVHLSGPRVVVQFLFLPTLANSCVHIY